MMIITRILLIIMFGGLFFQPVIAQAPPNGPCPPGAVPSGGRCVSPAEASANRNGGGRAASAPAYTEIWEDRYGAIAQDFDSGAGGTSENQDSKRKAERLALERCGTSKCKIVSSIRNSCQAAAAGGEGVAFGGGVGDIANSNALSKCQSDGSACEIKYTGCSLPVRVK